MIEDRMLSHDFDEEALGFDAPPERPRVLSAGEKIGYGLVGLGAFFLIASLTTGFLLGSWGGFLLSFGPLSIGAIVAWSSWYGARSAGIKNDGNFFRGSQNRGVVGWILGVGITGFYVVLYFYDSWQAKGLPALLEGPKTLVNPLSELITGQSADRWFLYGTLYTFAVVVFGVRMIWKYRHVRYQVVRTVSVMFFQLGFAFLIPGLLKLFHQPEFYFSYFWPLKPEYLWPGSLHGLMSHPGGLGVFMITWGAILSLVGTPLLTYFFGKRWYCSWVCGCGGLAETLGDPWRQQSVKSRWAWVVERWLIHAVLVLVVVTTAVLWINSATEGRVLGSASFGFAKFYGLWIGAVFSGVVGVGFYPLLGSRVWCRFGCPQAAILGIFQRFFSRFRITTNGSQCMSCGNCSTYCEMGIDVRAYAQRGENIVRASCVGCGVCSAVCPRGVLKLENGGTHGDRYEGAENPISVFLHDVATPPRQGHNT
ncbi:MAG: 4Fe-4S binding protein [Acidobacteriota bacterium]